MRSLEHQLSKIEKLAKRKVEELDLQNYYRYVDVYKVASQFLRKQPVLMYGGLAIHELMPASLKIYGEHTLPDIDMFSYKAKTVAHDLAKHLIAKGYEMTSVGDALHEGTFKVYSQGLQVADITYIPRKSYQRLSKGSVVGDLGIRVVNPQYLRMSLHKLLSLPYASDRWTKVFERIVNFYKAYPPPKCVLRKSSPHPSEEVLRMIYTFTHDCVHFGMEELRMILEKEVVAFPGVPPIMCLVPRNPLDYAMDLQKMVPSIELQVSTLYPMEEAAPLPAHVFLIHKRRKIAVFFEGSSCLSYNVFHQRRIATTHSIVYLYLAMMLSAYDHFQPMTDALECMANALSSLQLRSGDTKRKLLQQFVIECFGSQAGVVTLRRQRIERRQAAK
jgi:hypothetical protein